MNGYETGFGEEGKFCETFEKQGWLKFAKSVGSILTIKGIAQKDLKPRAVLITGLPLKIIIEKSIPVATWLSNIDIPVLIAQNDNDPLGSYYAITAYIQKIGNSRIRTVALIGDTHDYNNLERLKQLSSFLT